VNLDGEVIGINTLIRGMNTGIGFAVPSKLARQVADQLIDKGRFTRAWLGIGIATLADSREYRERVKGVEQGVVVTSVMRDGPAAKSGLELEDVIVAVDGAPVATLQELRNEIGGKKVGSEVSLEVVRDGRKVKVKVRPGELPEDQLAISRLPRREPAKETATSFGLKVQALTPQLAKQFGVEMTTGVIVTEVESGSVAEERGLQPGEVITSVNRKPVTSVKQFRDAMKVADPKKGVALSVVGESGRRLQILKDSGD
ncbi:MAG TPA: PDZ domain-containing protein, partial [Verrucomicrobiae bacterium]